MVRHHVKKGSKGKGVSKGKRLEQEEKRKKEALKDLDRFAGSSEEEEEVDTEDESIDSNESTKEKTAKKSSNGGNRSVIAPTKNSLVRDDGEEADASSNEDDGDAEYSSSDDDEYGEVAAPGGGVESDDDDSLDEKKSLTKIGTRKPAGQAGMAGAMSRILGLAGPPTASTSSTTTKKPVVLSKTITPLQKLQKKEKAKEDAFREKRKSRRQENLTAMHIPLSAATSLPVKKASGGDALGKAIAKELEMERLHRRVATRGVVALFNTISQHQQQKVQQAAESSLGTSSIKNNNQVQNMSKHGFLDMLKKTGSSNDTEEKKKANSDQDMKNNSNKKRKQDKIGSSGWNALKDDFMMNSKLKDWDKDLSDEDSDEDVQDKSGDTDAMMDDDWSSDEEKASKKRSKVTG